MSVYIRRLSVAEKMDRMRARYAAQDARHNAGVLERLDLEPVPSRREQVRDEFSAARRR